MSNMIKIIIQCNSKISESSDSRQKSVQCNLIHHYNISTFDHFSLSSRKALCLWDKYYAEFSTVESVALFLSLLIDHKIMCLSISNPVFLLQKPLFCTLGNRIVHRNQRLSNGLSRCLLFCYKKAAGLTTQCLLYHKHYGCVQACKQLLSRHYIQEFGWVSSLFCYVCPEML